MKRHGRQANVKEVEEISAYISYTRWFQLWTAVSLANACQTIFSFLSFFSGINEAKRRYFLQKQLWNMILTLPPAHFS